MPASCHTCVGTACRRKGHDRARGIFLFCRDSTFSGGRQLALRVSPAPRGRGQRVNRAWSTVHVSQDWSGLVSWAQGMGLCFLKLVISTHHKIRVLAGEQWGCCWVGDEQGLAFWPFQGLPSLQAHLWASVSSRKGPLSGATATWGGLGLECCTGATPHPGLCRLLEVLSDLFPINILPLTFCEEALPHTPRPLFLAPGSDSGPKVRRAQS